MQPRTGPLSRSQDAPSVAAEKKYYGYAVRPPYPSENEYFLKNLHVGGMAAEDGRVVLNPHSKLDEAQREAVARNEAIRLYIRDNGIKFDFEPTEHQAKFFQGTAYGNPEAVDDMRSTIMSRILTNDNSVGTPSPRQVEWSEWLRRRLEAIK